WQFLVIICHLTLYCHKASLVDNFIEDPDFVAIAPNFDAFALTGHCPHMSHPQETIHLIKQYLATVYATCIF
ncbi:MAG: hypothetical protein WBB28_25475, partial [Crinalium sp.]